MKVIGVLTATRAEYGLLKPVIEKLRMFEFETRILVTGAHLSEAYGMTSKAIEKDGYTIDVSVPILTNDVSPKGISIAMGNAMMGFAEYFSENKLDALVVLGDRYETLAVCCAAMNERIPIFHIHGGETTEGAVDEAIRHSITKMSYLHFTSTEVYRRRVIQLGEEPWRVFNVGAIGVENILKIPLLSKNELEKSLGFILDKPYAVLTFHPVTLDESSVLTQVEEVLGAIEVFKDIKFIITGANADAGGARINERMMEFQKQHVNDVYMVNSLGIVRYLTALKYAEFVIGNSSSGIIEAPSIGIPTVNIGNRQKGRLRAESVIDCKTVEKEIITAIKLARTAKMKEKAKNVKNPYEKANTSKSICSIIKKFFDNDEIQLKKKFYDLW